MPLALAVQRPVRLERAPRRWRPAARLVPAAQVLVGSIACRTGLPQCHCKPSVPRAYLKHIGMTLVAGRQVVQAMRVPRGYLDIHALKKLNSEFCAHTHITRDSSALSPISKVLYAHFKV